MGDQDLVFVCEANKCVDVLTNMACDRGFSLMLYEHCHAQFNLLILVDSIGISITISVNKLFS